MLFLIGICLLSAVFSRRTHKHKKSHKTRAKDVLSCENKANVNIATNWLQDNFSRFVGQEPPSSFQRDVEVHLKFLGCEAKMGFSALMSWASNKWSQFKEWIKKTANKIKSSSRRHRRHR